MKKKLIFGAITLIVNFGLTFLSSYIFGGMPFMFIIDQHCTVLANECPQQIDWALFGMDYIFWLMLVVIAVVLVKVLVFKVKRDMPKD